MLGSTLVEASPCVGDFKAAFRTGVAVAVPTANVSVFEVAPSPLLRISTLGTGPNAASGRSVVPLGQATARRLGRLA